MVKDLLDPTGKIYVTLPPIAAQDPITGKVFLASRTEGASVGYSFDGKQREVYNGAITLSDNVSHVFLKAVRYGWKESYVG